MGLECINEIKMSFDELKDRMLQALAEHDDPRARLIEDAIHDLERAEPLYPPGLREAWLRYRAYRKREGKKWYKTLKTEQEAVDGLFKKAGMDVACLIEAIDDAMLCGYTGVFPKLKPKSNEPSKSNFRSLVIEAERQGRGRAGHGGTLF